MSGNPVLQNKVALVTGGTQGIGRAVAQRFARDGAAVVVTYSRDDAAARETVEAIVREGGRAVALKVELGVEGDAVRLWEAFDAEASEFAPDGGLDILVHNAAAGDFGGLGVLTEATFDQVFAVSVKAPFFITKLGLPRLRTSGRIITISSLAATLASPEMPAYGAAKGAMNSFTLSLAKELGPRAITVNAIAPGVVLTRNNTYLVDDQAAAERAASRTALGRLGRTEDVADVAAFLAGPDSRWVTGQIIEASGGTAL